MERLSFYCLSEYVHCLFYNKLFCVGLGGVIHLLVIALKINHIENLCGGTEHLIVVDKQTLIETTPFKVMSFQRKR